MVRAEVRTLTIVGATTILLPETSTLTTYEEELRASLDPKYAHLSEDLHVEIAAYGSPAEAYARIAYALAEVRKYLIPDSNDEIRQEQMREMELIQTNVGDNNEHNGTTTTSPQEIVRSSTAPIRGPRMIGPNGGMAIRNSGRGLISVPTKLLSTRAGSANVTKTTLSPRARISGSLPTKIKVLSILERARTAMEESYGIEADDIGIRRRAGFYEHSFETYQPVGYGNLSDYDGAEEYYDTVEAAYSEEATDHWKGFKSIASGVARERMRYRTNPYSRSSK